MIDGERADDDDFASDLPRARAFVFESTCECGLRGRGAWELGTPVAIPFHTPWPSIFSTRSAGLGGFPAFSARSAGPAGKLQQNFVYRPAAKRDSERDSAGSMLANIVGVWEVIIA